MKKEKNLILTVAIVVAVASALTMLVLYFFFRPEKKGGDAVTTGEGEILVAENIFMCNTADEVKSYAEANNIPCRNNENGIMHLYDAEYCSYKGYCIVECGENSGKVYRVEYNTIIENDENLSKAAEKLKNTFLSDFDLSGEYEYFPVDEDNDNPGEQDFLEQRASKNLYAYDNDITWSISLYITDEGVSVRISRVELY